MALGSNWNFLFFLSLAPTVSNRLLYTIDTLGGLQKLLGNKKEEEEKKKKARGVVVVEGVNFV